ncbi:dehydrodolichyl diphosphate synthase complex subunit DHDDS isoform X1 [Pieris napi]|uniref:dehydrodolichyl diphosphate synthase complex subunit DHDDS isoform X1 n=1 Tax=Pieris napi TaxID=78633 RepID=UPI001FBB63C1|nr:dehydrodolichyl diphosphate synthase complex subunit DHDDS isoform X1 [Pieris napi]
MSDWVNENCVSFFQLFCIKVVKTGRVPQHIAFIMDGNRRYAKKLSVKTSDGHSRGFDKLSETLKWCLDLGIPEVTVYAFSIENFKRSDEEVNALMDLARDKFQRLLDAMDQINDWGVRIHVAGRMSLLPSDLCKMVSQAMLATLHNNKLRLNIAYAYTGRDEISRAASHIADGVNHKDITTYDINEELVSQTLDLGPPELLIRTSGEVRLSDFMLWQTANTVLYFSDALWPEFTVWNLLVAIIHFQRYAPPPLPQKDNNGNQDKFLQKLEEKRLQQLKNYIECSS